MAELPATNGRRPTVLIVEAFGEVSGQFTDIAMRYADPEGAGQ